MTDIFTQIIRSEIMSKIRGKNTKPELVVRKFLFSHGFRYRINQKKIIGSPDIVLKKYKTVIFINGCFWHGHENCRYFNVPKTRVEFWVNKIESNRARDKSNYKELEKLNWHVITIWECQLKKAVKEETLSQLLNKIQNF